MRMRMNVYLTTGKKNYKYAYVTIKSLFENNQNSEIYLYIVSEDLEESDLRYEYELAHQYGDHIVILRFDEQTAGKYIQFKPGDHWAIGTMSSYWLFHELLPEDVDRILVVESDTVVVGDLTEIYNTEFEGNYVICPGPEHKPKNHRDFMKEIGGDCLTFVLSIYDVKRIRRDYNLQDILSKDAIVKKQTGNSQMEYTFGLLFAGKIKYVPGKYPASMKMSAICRNLAMSISRHVKKQRRSYTFPLIKITANPGTLSFWCRDTGSGGNMPKTAPIIRSTWKDSGRFIMIPEPDRRTWRRIFPIAIFCYVLFYSWRLYYAYFAW